MIASDPHMITIVFLLFTALLIGILLNRFDQPVMLAYIIAGIALGPFGLKVITDANAIGYLGNIGVILLLFFLGMEISLPKMITKWKVAILGTGAQILLSVIIMFVLGKYLGWPLARSLLLGFVISLSSTSVLLKLLEKRKAIDSKEGRDVISILLAQDLAIVPMLIIISAMTTTPSIKEISLQGMGALLIVCFIIFLLKKKEIHLPFKNKIKEDSELQLLAAFVLCFGFALITGFFQLSAALGAFLAGMFIAAAKERKWVEKHLHSFKDLFLALFFVSIGMLINLQFIKENAAIIGGMVLLVFFTNTFINGIIFRLLGETWQYALYAGSLLAQIGEFSFLLVAIGKQSHVISDFAYQLTVATIAITLLLSPFWISFFAQFLKTIKKVSKVMPRSKISVCKSE